MILIITHKEDYTADYVVNLLNEKGIDYHRFNCEDIFSETISLKFGGKSSIEWFEGKDIQSVWYRRTKLPIVNTGSTEENLYLLKEFDALLANLMDMIPGKWMSNPAAVQRAENKFMQLRIAESVGLLVPETLITTSKNEIVNFYESHDRILVKP